MTDTLEVRLLRWSDNSTGGQTVAFLLPESEVHPFKNCLHCGSLFFRKTRNSSTEWTARKFCGARCSKRARGAVPVEERFWKYVTGGDADACWMWTGFCDANGYGRLHKGSEALASNKAHRVSWTIHNGPIPTGLGVLHKCDNPSCVNPGHLFLGTQRINNLDRDQKGRTKFDSKLTAEQAREIYQRAHAGEATGVLAKEFRVTAGNISNIKSGLSWSKVTGAKGKL